MFENEYVMDHKRFEKWTVPKFWCTPSFYIWICVFIVSAFALWYFKNQDTSNRWVTLAIFLMVLSIYRAFLRRWMVQNKQYRLMAQQYFNEKPWKCRIVVSNNYIEIYLNDKLNNTVGWDQIKKLLVAKSHFLLSTGNGREGVQLDKNSFTKGTPEGFVDYIKASHSNISIENEIPAYNC